MDMMDKREDNQPPSDRTAKGLRQRAEDLAHAKLSTLQHSPDAMWVASMQKTLHELQVHQIELEMQNEELRRTQLQLEATRARYFDLYDLAPVGYCTVNNNGLILEANIATATLLGVERNVLLGQAIQRFISPSGQDVYYQCRRQLLESGSPQNCELLMARTDGSQCWVQLTTSAAQDEHGAAVQHMVLNDVSEAKIMATAMRESEARYRALAEQMPGAVAMPYKGKT